MKSKFNFIIVVVIFLFIALIFRYSPSIEDKTISEDIPFNGQQENEKNFTSEKIQTSSDLIALENLIPDTNYSCESNIPEEIQIFFDSTSVDKLGNSILSLRKDVSMIKNNISLNGLCEYNLEIGQKASEFLCEGSYIIENKQISNDGIIQEKNPKTITYTMNFDDSSCEVVQGFGLRGILKCKVISAMCEWNYGKLL